MSAEPRPTDLAASNSGEINYDDLIEPVGYDFGLSRRAFVQVLGTGLLVAVSMPALAQERRRGRGFQSRGAETLSARIHIGKDGSLTVFTGKVEAGQGARAELTQAAAEELRVPASRVQLVMSDTSRVPDDGMTAGSRTTPSTVPAVREGAASARELLAETACRQWRVGREEIQVRDGKAMDRGGKRTFSYADLANNPEAIQVFQKAVPRDVSLTAVKDWKVMGTSFPRPNGRDIVTGTHRYPSDISLPGMLYGKILRPPAFGAKLTTIDLAPARTMKDVVVVRDGQFVGVATPTRFQATAALDAISKTARWEKTSQPSSDELFAYLKQHAEENPENPFQAELKQAAKVLRQTYEVAYAQHAPLEPRAAAAEWKDGKLTVWTGTQNPFGFRSELSRAFHLAEDRIRVIVPDFGAAFGGKHTGEAAIEVARLAQGAGRPASVRWTREEEFTWAYFRPAGVIEIEASLDARGTLTSWHYVNINSGGAAIETPYRTRNRSRFVRSDPPLRQGSYRALAATANNFARESFMDELAAEAGADPLEFRLAHLDNLRVRAVLETAAEKFGWKARVKKKSPTAGVGLACGTEKGSCVAACVEIEIDPQTRVISVHQVCEAFECGAIVNPDNLRKQVEGAIIMGLGPALREAVRFENGEILTRTFSDYRVPRYHDVPGLDIQLLNRPDIPSAGAGETPIIAVAPAIANAVFHATGQRVRSMPIRLPEPKGA